MKENAEIKPFPFSPGQISVKLYLPNISVSIGPAKKKGVFYVEVINFKSKGYRMITFNSYIEARDLLEEVLRGYPQPGDKFMELFGECFT